MGRTRRTALLTLALGLRRASRLGGDDEGREHYDETSALRLISTRGRCRSSRASCGPRRGSGRATCRGHPRASGSGSTRPARPSACRARRPPDVSQRWPWTWNVWKSEPIAITSHCTRSPTFGVEDRSVADERPAVDRHELAPRREHDLELTVGCALVASEDREHPVHAALDRVVHRRRVVVVGPHAGRVVAGGEPVGPRPARTARRRRGPRSRARRRRRNSAVVDAVEVHRVRFAAQRVHVLEVDSQMVADPRLDQRAGDQRARLRSRAARSEAASASARVAAVDEGREGRDVGSVVIASGMSP